MRHVTSVLLVLAVCIAVPGASQAFDGRRSGFILGFGAGPGLSSFKQTLTVSGMGDTTSSRENKFAIGTDFRIGGGIGNRFMLYYANRIAWHTLDNVLGETVIITNGVGLLGASYYLREDAPSGYVTGIIGVATWDAPLEEGSEAQVGFGIGVGGGWEFAPHWSVEATLNWGKPSDEAGSLKIETSALSVLVTIVGLAY